MYTNRHTMPAPTPQPSRNIMVEALILIAALVLAVVLARATKNNSWENDGCSWMNFGSLWKREKKQDDSEKTKKSEK